MDIRVYPVMRLQTARVRRNAIGRYVLYTHFVVGSAAPLLYDAVLFPNVTRRKSVR